MVELWKKLSAEETNKLTDEDWAIVKKMNALTDSLEGGDNDRALRIIEELKAINPKLVTENVREYLHIACELNVTGAALEIIKISTPEQLAKRAVVCHEQDYEGGVDYYRNTGDTALQAMFTNGAYNKSINSLPNTTIYDALIEKMNPSAFLSEPKTFLSEIGNSPSTLHSAIKAEQNYRQQEKPDISNYYKDAVEKMVAKCKEAGLDLSYYKGPKYNIDSYVHKPKTLEPKKPSNNTAIAATLAGAIGAGAGFGAGVMVGQSDHPTQPQEASETTLHQTAPSPNLSHINIAQPQIYPEQKR